MKLYNIKTNIFLSIIFLFFGILNVKAQSAVENNDNSVFWEISGNGLEKPSYLLGTIHLIPKADFVFTDKMKESFNSCKTLVLEADINMSLKQQIDIVKKMMLPKDKPLNKYMSDAQFAEYKSYLLDTVKLKKSMFKKVLKLKPMFSSALILGKLLEKPTAYEQELSKKAKELNMQFAALETLDFQLSIFDKISVEEQVEMIFADKNNLDILTGYNEMLAAYKSGDLNKLSELSKSDISFKKYEKEFLIDRNIDWIPKIDKIIKNNPAFIAVGSAHLAGELGVVKLLRSQGYTVKPIK